MLLLVFFVIVSKFITFNIQVFSLCILVLYKYMYMYLNLVHASILQDRPKFGSTGYICMLMDSGWYQNRFDDGWLHVFQAESRRDDPTNQGTVSTPAMSVLAFPGFHSVYQKKYNICSSSFQSNVFDIEDHQIFPTDIKIVTALIFYTLHPLTLQSVISVDISWYSNYYISIFV